MDDKDFRDLFRQIANLYELAPDIAAELLQRILNILPHCDPADEYS